MVFAKLVVIHSPRTCSTGQSEAEFTGIHPFLRAALGPAYPPLMRLKGSRIVQSAKAGRGAASYWAAVRRDPARMGVDLTSPIGFGALIAHTLLLHAHFERSGIAGYVRARSPLYSTGDEDVLARFFERESWPADLSPMPSSAAEYLGRFKRSDQIDLERARALYARHFRPNARLRDAVAAAAGETQRYDLAVHYRGTDKFLESGQVDASRMFGLIERHLDGIAAPQIFLATDDEGFGRTVRQRFAQARFHSFDLGYVKAGAPRHFSHLGPDEKSLEALVNMQLLARAPVCVRTSSYLSAISALINPHLRTVTINQTQTGTDPLPFPERQILQSERMLGPPASLSSVNDHG